VECRFYRDGEELVMDGEWLYYLFRVTAEAVNRWIEDERMGQIELREGARVENLKPQEWAVVLLAMEGLQQMHSRGKESTPAVQVLMGLGDALRVGDLSKGVAFDLPMEVEAVFDEVSLE